MDWVTTDNSRVREPNFTKLGQVRYAPLSQHCISFQNSNNLLRVFQKTGGSSWAMLKKTPNLSLLPLWILGEGWARWLYHCWSFTYDRTFEVHWPSTAWLLQHGGLIKKKQIN